MVAAGFLILAACPGQSVGPPFVAIANADVPHCHRTDGDPGRIVGNPLPLVFWLPLLERFPSPANELDVSYVTIIQALLVTQILPLAIGVGFHEGDVKADCVDR